MAKMQLTEPQRVEEALTKGARVAVFVLDEDGKPTEKISELYREEDETQKLNETVRKVKQYIDIHFGKELHLKDLAGVADVSPTHLCRIFSLEMGQTVGEYILSVRMETAARLLLTTDENAVNVAREVGCPDCGYFHKLFKKYFGCTPITYRKTASLLNGRLCFLPK